MVCSLQWGRVSGLEHTTICQALAVNKAFIGRILSREEWVPRSMPSTCPGIPIPERIGGALGCKKEESPTNHLWKVMPLAVTFMAFLQGWAHSSPAELHQFPFILAWGYERWVQVPLMKGQAITFSSNYHSQ